MKSEAEWLLKEHFGHTEALPECPRALRRMLLEMADLLVDDRARARARARRASARAGARGEANLQVV